MSRHSAARRPALRMPAKPSGPWILIRPVRIWDSRTSSTRAMAQLSPAGPPFRAHPGQATGDANFGRADIASIAQDFNVRARRRGQAGCVGGVEVGAGGEALAVG